MRGMWEGCGRGEMGKASERGVRVCLLMPVRGGF